MLHKNRKNLHLEKDENMTYNEAVALVSAEFETRRVADHVMAIRTNMTYDGNTGFSVLIYDNGKEVYLTDIGQTKEIFNEVSEPEWVELCRERGFAFNHWRIEHKLESMDDVYEYIEFLDFISDKFWEIDEY